MKLKTVIIAILIQFVMAFVFIHITTSLKNSGFVSSDTKQHDSLAEQKLVLIQKLRKQDSLKHIKDSLKFIVLEDSIKKMAILIKLPKDTVVVSAGNMENNPKSIKIASISDEEFDNLFKDYSLYNKLGYVQKTQQNLMLRLRTMYRIKGLAPSQNSFLRSAINSLKQKEISYFFQTKNIEGLQKLNNSGQLSTQQQEKLNEMLPKIPIQKKKREDTAEYIVHKIQEGETVYSIAKKYNITIEILRRANPDGIKNDTIISSGNVLSIPIVLKKE